MFPVGAWNLKYANRVFVEDRRALTHSDRYSGTTLLFNWTAPATPQGHIQIMASFVQRFDSFWPMVASVVVSDPLAPSLSVNPNDLRTPFITPCEIDRPTTPPPPTTRPLTTPTTATTTISTTTTRSTTTTTTMLTSPTTRKQLTPPRFVTTPPELIDLSKQASLQFKLFTALFVKLLL
ncbi:hypothetical protein PoB_000792800 [Plakobranchus ocellatus]|uniref:Reelin domain-containing protein n=1 Tax=Plakobranchus ocellatus TaxID=259542 RepID=A0AAV3YG00_9GAST|nr:hypothetical protein PoB_000792800 [Plakobranchus ocellatus]